MKLSYTLTDRDYIDYNIYHSTHAPSQRRTQALLRFAAPLLLVFIFFGFGSSRWPRNWSYAIGAAVYAAWVLIWPRFHRRVMVRVVDRMIKDGRRNEFAGAFTLELADNCLRESGNGRVTEMGYDQVEKVVRDGDRFYIYVGAISACIVPVRAFRDQAEQEAFFRILSEKTRPYLPEA